jgi:hypothetical protein
MIMNHPWLAVPVSNFMQVSFTPGPDWIAQSHSKTWISLMPIGQKFQMIEKDVSRSDAGTDGHNFKNDSGIILRRKCMNWSLLDLFLSGQTGCMSPVCTIAAKYCEKFIDGNSSSVKTC